MLHLVDDNDISSSMEKQLSVWYLYHDKLLKQERGDDQIFPEHTHMGPKVSQPFPV